MKIAHVCQWFMPGLGYQENYLPQEQARLGHEVWLLTGDRLSPNYQRPGQPLPLRGVSEEDGVHLWRLPVIPAGTRRGGWSQVFLHGLGRALRQVEPDLVHAHGLWMPSTVQALLQRPSYALVADEHVDNANLPTGLSARAKLTVARWTCRRLQRLGGKIFAVNPFCRQFVIEVMGAPPDMVHLLPLGVDVHTFYPDHALRVEGRRKLALPEEACVFVTSGRLTPGKGFELLLMAFADVYHRHSNGRLVFIGAGSAKYEGQLRRQAADLGIDDAVIFLGWMSQEELGTYYNAADVGVMPGKLGGIKEILGVGRPLVVPDHLATGYLVDMGNGLTFDPDECSDLAQAMARYIEEPELRRQHSERSLRAARERLSWRAIAEKSLQ